MKNVYFVGAGPGATDLITVRGKQLLEKADLIIYAGSLVNAQLLAYAKASCHVENSAYLTLDEVIQRIKEAVERGFMVVRLHTGDPSLYGAIREQIDRLNALGITWEICPGVSSFSAAAAAIGAEYTLPSVSQTVILTRAAGRTPVPDKESIASLASHQATLVLFLSAALLTQVQTGLIRGGYRPETPAAIIYKASWPDQKIVHCTVQTLSEAAAADDIRKTALILVGNFLGEDYELSRLYAEDFDTEFRQAKR